MSKSNVLTMPTHRAAETRELARQAVEARKARIASELTREASERIQTPFQGRNAPTEANPALPDSPQRQAEPRIVYPGDRERALQDEGLMTQAAIDARAGEPPLWMLFRFFGPRVRGWRF